MPSHDATYGNAIPILPQAQKRARRTQVREGAFAKDSAGLRVRRDSAHARTMSKADREMRSIVAKLASVRARLAAIENEAITHIDEAERAHDARRALADEARQLEARFAAFEDRRVAAA